MKKYLGRWRRGRTNIAGGASPGGGRARGAFFGSSSLAELVRLLRGRDAALMACTQGVNDIRLQICETGPGRMHGAQNRQKCDAAAIRISVPYRYRYRGTALEPTSRELTPPTRAFQNLTPASAAPATWGGYRATRASGCRCRRGSATLD